MANTVVRARQWPLVACTPVLGIANIGAGLGYDVKIPPGAYVTELYVDTLVAFDGTTNTITATDGTSIFVNAQDAKSIGRETAAIASKYYPSGGVISFNMAQTGSATVGSAIGVVQYIGLDRETEVISN